MTDPLFLDEQLADPLPNVGDLLVLGGEEGRHAAVVRRMGVGESVVISDGRGRGVRGAVTAVGKSELTIQVSETLWAPQRPRPRFVVVQALAKSDRAELACAMLTELGVHEIIPWQASRSVVRWSGDRGTKSLARWRSTVREATKQSRRLTVPTVCEAVSTEQLRGVVAGAALALVLHEKATLRLADAALPEDGAVVVVVGPEGGLTDAEIDVLTAAGARTVLLSDGVLRTSTAGVVALAGLLLR